MLTWNLIPEPELTPTREADIRRMLVASFPEYTEFFTHNSFWGSKPEYRLIAEDANQQPAAHLEFGYRTITVADAPVKIAGVGAVAVHPDHQGKQVGKLMFANLRQYLLKNTDVEFAFLGCHDEVEKFYATAGFTRVHQNVYNLNPDSNTWETYHGPTMVMPIHKSLNEWRTDGIIHLRGMPW